LSRLGALAAWRFKIFILPIKSNLQLQAHPVFSGGSTQVICNIWVVLLKITFFLTFLSL
jgi:hypothetical protein